jgi:AbrB family looped-hinge helix DNA binding protein
MRVTSKGQVTIPRHIREKAGLLPHANVEFRFNDRGEVVLFRAAKDKKGKGLTRGERIVAHLTGRGNKKMTTDEIMALTRGE